MPWSDIVEDESTARARNVWVEKALSNLTSRERQIIESRFLDDRKLTLAEIGEEFGVSKERIRQIENRALEKMHAVLAEFPGRPQDFFTH